MGLRSPKGKVGCGHGGTRAMRLNITKNSRLDPDLKTSIFDLKRFFIFFHAQLILQQVDALQNNKGLILRLDIEDNVGFLQEGLHPVR